MATPFLSNDWFVRAKQLAESLPEVAGTTCTVQFRLACSSGDLVYHTRLVDGRVVALDRGPAGSFDVSVVESLETATAVHVTGELSLADGVLSGAIDVTGSSEAGLNTFGAFLARPETDAFMGNLRAETLPFEEGNTW